MLAVEVIAQKVETFGACINDFRFRRVQRQPVFRDPLLHQFEHSLSLLGCAAEDHEIIGVAYHLEAGFGDEMIQRIEIDVAQQRAQHGALRDTGLGLPSLRSI